jgi:GT2 family glycosyltransferase
MSVIVAAWNAAAVLDACLESLRSQRIDGGFETIVVEDASTDSTRDVLRRHEDHVRVIANERNLGFSESNNRAAREASGRVLLFLNADTELLRPDVLERLAGAAEQPDVAIAGPKLLNPDGTLQPSSAAHPGVGRALLVGAGLHRLLPDAALARVSPWHWSHDRSRDTGWVMGAALAIRADVFRDLGGFWPTMYAEEQDLAYRAQQRGLRVRFESDTSVMHVGNHSNAQRWSERERAGRVAGAELEFLRAHYGRGRAAAIRAVSGAAYASRAVVLAALGRRDRAAVYRDMARVYRRDRLPGRARRG